MDFWYRFYDTDEEAENAAAKLNREEKLRGSERVHGVAPIYERKRVKADRYQFLRTAASIFRVLGWIVLVAGIIGSIVGAATTGGSTGALIAIVGIIYSVVVWVFFLASRELIYLFMDVEENTRNTARRLGK